MAGHTLVQLSGDLGIALIDRAPALNPNSGQPLEEDELPTVYIRNRECHASVTCYVLRTQR